MVRVLIEGMILKHQARRLFQGRQVVEAPATEAAKSRHVPREQEHA